MEWFPPLFAHRTLSMPSISQDPCPENMLWEKEMKNRYSVPTVKGLLCNSQVWFLSTHLPYEFHFLPQSAAGNVPDMGLSIRGSSYQSIKQNVMDRILLLEWEHQRNALVSRIIELWHAEGREESNDSGIYFMPIT